MNERFFTMLYNGRFLIVKTPEDKPPFVVAETFTENLAADVCEALTDLAEKRKNEGQKES